ncbi:MAG TPA: hypothetical protein VKQ36_15795 [Ktedonobacterales bacterium]|nr:hypothetical protein [Ktedonobacterales bacterium]
MTWLLIGVSALVVVVAFVVNIVLAARTPLQQEPESEETETERKRARKRTA